MKQKEYEKKFREMFGVEPFTEEESQELKAMLFYPTLLKDCCTAGAYNARYMNAFNNFRFMQEQAEAGGLVEQDAIELLERKGYKITK